MRSKLHISLMADLSVLSNLNSALSGTSNATTLALPTSMWYKPPSFRFLSHDTQNNAKAMANNDFVFIFFLSL